MYSKLTSLCAAALLVSTTFVSCDKDTPNNSNGGSEVTTNDFQIAFANGSGSNSSTLVQGVADLSSGVVNSRIGHELESSRTARIFVSTDRKHLYSLNYTVGTIEKLIYKGGDKYEQIGRIDASVPLGSKTIRFTMLNDKEGSIHYIKATAIGKDLDYQKHQMIASFGILDLGTMQLKDGYQKEVEVTLPDELATAGYFISRIDAPVLSNGKLYYGAAVSKWNKTTGKATATDKTFTLVVDYNDFTKTSVVTADFVRGATNGYRTPTQHMMEDGSILQMVSGVQANKQQEVHFVRLKDGKYDTAFDINLSALLNKGTRSDGFFYVGNGILYIPYEDLSTESKVIGVDPEGKPTTSAMWKLARIDINKKSAIDLDVPDNLWLRQYQNSVVRNGVFYIALAPIGKEGNIYMFDINSEAKTGKLGASLQGTGADQYFIGIY